MKQMQLTSVVISLMTLALILIVVPLVASGDPGPGRDGDDFSRGDAIDNSGSGGDSSGSGSSGGEADHRQTNREDRQ